VTTGKLRTRNSLFCAALAFLTLVLAVATASCGGDGGDKSAYTPVQGTESPYCDTYRAWQVHELDGGEGDDQPNPAAFRAYWKDYLEFNATMLGQAPPEVRDDWLITERAVRTVLTPVLEKYDFDVQRIAEEGTPAEKSLTEPHGEAKRAQETIHAYEDRVCGVATPQAANVAFKADGSSKDYCAALKQFNSGFAKVEASRFDPDQLRTVFTADAFTEQLDALDESAPTEIASDQEAVSEWFRTRWSDVIAKYDYDIRRIWVEGTPEDRAVFTFTHPDIVEHDSRQTAYEEKVCSE
jgi:hypothetical protein